MPMLRTWGGLFVAPSPKSNHIFLSILSSTRLAWCDIWNEHRSPGLKVKPLFIPWPRHNLCCKGVYWNACFLHGCLDVCYRSWDKSKNPCPCRNHTFPMHHWNLESTWPAASCFPGPDNALQWEMCNFCTGMVSCWTVCYILHHWHDLNCEINMKLTTFTDVALFIDP